MIGQWPCALEYDNDGLSYTWEGERSRIWLHRCDCGFGVTRASVQRSDAEVT